MTDITDERLAEMLEAIAPPVGAVVLKGADLEAVRSVISQLLAVRPALRTIHEAIPKFLHPTSDMTNQEFIGIVLGAVDNAKVNKALEKDR